MTTRSGVNFPPVSFGLVVLCPFSPLMVLGKGTGVREGTVVKARIKLVLFLEGRDFPKY